jgi:hypothetical protein
LTNEEDVEEIRRVRLGRLSVVEREGERERSPVWLVRRGRESVRKVRWVGGKMGKIGKIGKMMGLVGY